MMKKKSTTISTTSSVGGSQSMRLILFLAIVVIAHVHIGIGSLAVVAAADDAIDNEYLPTTQTIDDEIAKNDILKEAFLKWFIDNGGIFHPIKVRGVDDGNTETAVNVTIQPFPDFGGWGLALPLPPPTLAAADATAAAVDIGSNECLPDDNPNGQCTTATASNDNTDRSSSKSQSSHTTAIIKRLDPLFTVPSSLILSVNSILDTYTIESSPYYLSSYYSNVNNILLRSYPTQQHAVGLSRHNSMGLVEQDVVIAMHLMVEDCHHRLYNTRQPSNYLGIIEEDSHWGPYLDVLPQYLIPRLDTFGDEEYEALADDNLEFVGRNSKRLLERLFGITHEEEENGGTTDAETRPTGAEISLQNVIREMIDIKLDKMMTTTSSLSDGSTASIATLLDSCTSFETFHRFVGIVASRAMVLHGRKYLTPLADMINYAPYVEPTDMSEGDSRHYIKAPFTLFHTLSESNSITVRSDRDVFLPPTLFGKEGAESAGEGTTTTIQLFEDYGPVDNSLFLEAHGFVPNENPNNCAIIPGSYFLRRYAAVGRFDKNVALVLRALKVLHLIHPVETKLEALNDMCVKSNLDIIDDGDDVGRKPASDALAITTLVLSDSGNTDWMQIEKEYGQSFTSLREKCIAAIHTEDIEIVEIRCARYPGSASVVTNALRTAARRVIASLEEQGDTETALRIQLQQAELLGRNQLSLALRFRLEERKILNRIGTAEDVLDFPPQKSVEPKNDRDVENDDTLENKLIAFKSFVEALDLPLNKIEPRLVGNGMRLGAFATEDLDAGESYISLSSNSAIDVDTALEGIDKSSALAALLQKYSLQQGSLPNDGFDTLLLYLLHERFILNERSRWWAYLDLLPSIADLREFHPLFFDHEDMNRYLSGSDVRRFIIRYQRLSSERHKALSSDLAVNLVLGCETILDRDKVYWATAILDSRSIWWNGKRHLVPLLDLVNADVVGSAHETRLEDSDNIVEGKVAVTRASRYVKKGDQVFENYAQPNYQLFTYHGFLLDKNRSDCALLDGLFIHRHDPGAKYAHRLPTTAPTFCIRDKDSIEELSQFFRMKYGLSLNSHGVDESVRPYLIQVLERRIARLTELMSTIVHDGENTKPRLQFMMQIVKNDLLHFQHALDNYVLISRV